VQIIDRYIARNFLSGTAIVLAILLPLFGFLMLAEELEEVGNGTFTSFDALIVVGLSLPRLMLDLLPVTALLGVLIGLGAMANHRELIIINTFGFSARRIAWPVVKAVGGVILIVLLLQFLIMPGFELSAARVRSKAMPQTTIVSNDNEFWTRSGNRFIRIGHVIRHGRLSDVEIFDLGNNGALRELMQASSVHVLGDGQWLLKDVHITDFSAAEIREEHLQQKMWRSFLSAKQTSALIVPVEDVSAWAAFPDRLGAQYSCWPACRDRREHRHTVFSFRANDGAPGFVVSTQSATHGAGTGCVVADSGSDDPV